MHALGGPALVGREREMAQISSSIAGGLRLVSLLGPPGVGKTRLARECVERAGRDRPALFCDLSEAHALDVLSTTIGAALGVAVRRDSTAAVLAQLGDAIAARGRLLLVLDHLEPVTPLAREMIEAWLAHAREVQILATSRLPLDLPTEQRFEISALKSEAMELFLACARRVKPDLDPSPEDRRTIEALVTALGGIPLAIELAAARLSILGPREMLERLPVQLERAKIDKTDRSSHQRILRAALDGSWELLDRAERSALAQCSVFHGSFGLEAAAAVVRVIDVSRSVLDLLEALEQRSLVTRSEPGEARFRLPPEIRAYAAEQLQGKERREAERRRTELVSWQGRTLAAQLEHRAPPRPLERQNLLAAIETLLEEAAQDDAALVPLAEALGILELISSRRGATRASISLFDRAIELCGRAPELLSVLLLFRGRLARALGAVEEGARNHREALVMALERGDERLEAQLCLSLAAALVDRSALAEAEASLGRALEISRRLPERRFEASVTAALGAVHYERGRFPEARAAYMRAIALHRAAHDDPGLAEVLARLGVLCLDLGELEQAEAHQLEALEIARRTGRTIIAAQVFGQLGNLARRRGHRVDAEQRYDRAILDLRRAGELPLAGAFMLERAIMSIIHDDRAAAEKGLKQALQVLEPLENERCRALVHAALGLIAADEDRLAAAEAAFASAAAHIDGVEEPSFREAVDVMRGHLALAHGRAARARGDEAAARACWTDAKERLRASRTTASEPLFWSRELLQRALARAAPPAGALAIRGRGEALRLPSGEQLDLSTREPLRRLIHTLALERVASPGKAFSIDELFAAGWPGQVAVEASRVNRVRVALAELRKLGLGERIETVSGGYRLDPKLQVVLDAEL